jgi:hypothetical protein
MTEAKMEEIKKEMLVITAKLLVVMLFFVFLNLEIQKYTNTVSSLGEMIFYNFEYKISTIANFALIVLSCCFTYTRSKEGSILFFVLILLLLLLFYPLLDMTTDGGAF